MRLIQLNREPNDRQLRQFGLTASFALPLIGWLWAETIFGERNTIQVVGVTAAIGSAICLLALIKPRWIKPLFLGLSLITLPIGMVVGELVLILLYFLVFTPISLLFRLIGRDSLNRRIIHSAATYWQANPTAEREPKTYLHQF